MATIALRITGMSCEHCVAAVKEALEAVDGVECAEASLEKGRAEVIGNAEPPALVRAVAEKGYEAEPVA